MRSSTELIAQYIKIRNFIDAENKKFEATMAPYKEALEQIEAHMAGVALNEVGPSGKWSVATPVGTAFRKLYTNVKVADREEWMDFIFDGRREGFVTNHVPKDAVSEYVEQYGSQPPGLDITSGYRIQFNSPKGA